MYREIYFLREHECDKGFTPQTSLLQNNKDAGIGGDKKDVSRQVK
jgi:hypothetical protein